MEAKYIQSDIVVILRFGEHPLDSLDPWRTYGTVVTILIIFLRLLSFLVLPQVSGMIIEIVTFDNGNMVFKICKFSTSDFQILFSLVGFLTLNTFKPAPTFKSSPLLSPFVCVRVVTRGIYPNLGDPYLIIFLRILTPSFCISILLHL